MHNGKFTRHTVAALYSSKNATTYVLCLYLLCCGLSACVPIVFREEVYSPVEQASDYAPEPAGYSINLYLGHTSSYVKKGAYYKERNGPPYTLEVNATFREKQGETRLAGIEGKPIQLLDLTVEHVGGTTLTMEQVMKTAVPRPSQFETTSTASASSSLMFLLGDLLEFKPESELLISVAVQMPDGEVVHRSRLYRASTLSGLCATIICQQ